MREMSGFDYSSILTVLTDTLDAVPGKSLRRYRRWVSSLTVSMWTVDLDQGAMYLMTDWDGMHHWYYSKDELGIILNNYSLEKRYHYHDYYELLYVMDGEVNEWIEDECLCLRRGDAILLDKNVRHAEEYLQFASCVFLSLDTNCVENLLANEPPFSEGKTVIQFFLNHLAPNSDFLKAYCHFTALSCIGPMLPVEQEINSVMEEMLHKETGFWLLMQGHLRRLLGLLESPKLYHSALVYKGNDNKSELASAIRLQVEVRQGVITKQELAEQLNYNAAYLCRFIKQNFGKTFTEYCLSVRLNYAAQMLRSTRWSVATICDKLGFTNRTYFYKAFEKEYRMTPSNYRNVHSTMKEKNALRKRRA